MLPKKLKNDAIIEAICEIRFEVEGLPEIVTGRLSEMSILEGFTASRSALADIPKPIRDVNAQLKHQPLVSFHNKDDSQRVRVGGNVISYHVVGKKNYIGGESFKENLKKIVNDLFARLEGVYVTRVGFRYVNILNTEEHKIDSLKALDVDINVGGESREKDLNLSYFIKSGEQHGAIIKIITPFFVQSKIPDDAVAVIDIDVYTPEAYSETDPDEVVGWINEAHRYEKEAFFSLIPKDIQQEIVEEWE